MRKISLWLTPGLVLITLMVVIIPYNFNVFAQSYDGEEYSLTPQFTTIEGDQYPFNNQFTTLEGEQYPLTDQFTTVEGPQYPLTSPSCDFVFKYPECDSTAPGWVHEVWQDCNGTYLIKDSHFQGGVCGDVASVPQQSLPQQSCSFVFQYPECDATGLGWVHEAWQDCQGNYQIRNIHFQGGVCGHSFATTPQPTGPVSGGAGGSTTTPITVAPITVAPVFTPVFIPSEIVTCSNGFGQQICNSNIIDLQQISNQTQTATSTSNSSTGPINVTVH